MKSIVHTRSGDASVLHVADREIPDPGAGEVRVRVVVSGVNPTDSQSRAGRYGDETDGTTEFVPNQDGSGFIDAIGDGVDGLAIGDRVWIVLAAYQRPASGTAQEYTVVPAKRVFLLPAEADFETGASIGIPAITAHRTLTVSDDGPTRLHPGALTGKTVLVAGGAGAVGHAAIQLANWAGATVITTVSNDQKAVNAAAAGAHHVVNYRGPDPANKIREAAPEGVDLVVEVAPEKNLELDLSVLKPRGTIASYAMAGDGRLTLDIGQNMGLNARYQFVLLYTVGWEIVASAAADVNAAIVAGALPVGESAGLPLHRFTLEQTADAHRAVENGTVGKVLIRVQSDR